MLPLLLLLSGCRKPVILVPGTYASHLVGTGRNLDLSWYCPKNFEEKVVWLNEEYLIPPIYNCLCRWLGVKYNHDTGAQDNLPGMTIHTQDFGGLDGINHVDQTFFNISFIPYYTELIKLLDEKGYEEKIDLFGAPNDWRFGLAGMGSFFVDLKGLVETAYAQNNNKKVVLIGHSFGGFILQYFSSTYVDAAWAQKYLDTVILVAPSFGGSGEALDIAWSRTLRILPFRIEAFSNVFESAGAVHIHLPNYALYGNTTIVIGPNGEEYTAKDVPNLLIEHGRVTGDNIKLLELNVPFVSKLPDPPRVNTHIVYNSKHSTPLGLKIGSSWDNNKPDLFESGGDGTVLAAGLVNYCTMYAGPNLACHDIMQSGKNGSHFRMLLDDNTLEYIESLFED